MYYAKSETISRASLFSYNTTFNNINNPRVFYHDRDLNGIEMSLWNSVRSTRSSQYTIVLL